MLSWEDMDASSTTFKSKRRSDGQAICRNDEGKIRHNKSQKYENEGELLQAVALWMYSLNTIGTPIKGRATWPRVQKSKKHHTPNSESQVPLDKIFWESPHAKSAHWIPRITWAMISDKAKARKFWSASYPTITHKGKGRTPLLAKWETHVYVDFRPPWQSKLGKRPTFSSSPRMHLQQRSTCSKIEETPLSLISKSQTFNRSACSKIEETPLSGFREPGFPG